MRVESSGWSGEGTFTAVVLEALRAVDAIERLRVEDAPASRAEPGYAFISNEIYVQFRAAPAAAAWRRFGPGRRPGTGAEAMTLTELAVRLGGAIGVGEPDYSDEGLLQYLRTERVTAPHQAKGFKVVEMVRIYEAGTSPRA